MLELLICQPGDALKSSLLDLFTPSMYFALSRLILSMSQVEAQAQCLSHWTTELEKHVPAHLESDGMIRTPNYWLFVFVRDYDEHSQLLSRVQKLELEFSQMRSELLTGESVRTSCEKKIDVIHQKVGSVTVTVRLGTPWFGWLVALGFCGFWLLFSNFHEMHCKK